MPMVKIPSPMSSLVLVCLVCLAGNIYAQSTTSAPAPCNLYANITGLYQCGDVLMSNESVVIVNNLLVSLPTTIGGNLTMQTRDCGPEAVCPATMLSSSDITVNGDFTLGPYSWLSSQPSHPINVTGNMTMMNNVTVETTNIVGEALFEVGGCLNFGGNLLVSTAKDGGILTVAKYSCYTGSFERIIGDDDDDCYPLTPSPEYGGNRLDVIFTSKRNPACDEDEFTPAYIALGILISIAVAIIVVTAILCGVPSIRRRICRNKIEPTRE